MHKYIDELGRFLAVADGFVIQDPKDGYYYYAHIAEDGTVTPSRFKVGIDDDAEGLQSVLQHSDSALRGIRSRARDGEAEFPPIDLWVSHVYNENWLQPDGTPFTVERFMDEVGRYLRTEIGYVICHQEYGYCYYAQIAGDGTVTPSPFKAGIDDEAEKLEPVVQQSRYAVEELTSRYHNGEEIEAYVDLWSRYSEWVVLHGGDEESLLCDELEIPRDENELGPDSHQYGPGRILIYLRPAEQVLFDRLKEAAAQGHTISGVAPFDSVSAVYRLKEIQLLSEAGLIFSLKFDEDRTLTPIARGYCGLPYFERVMLDRYMAIGEYPWFPEPTNLVPTSWGDVKEGHRRRRRGTAVGEGP